MSQLLNNKYDISYSKLDNFLDEILEFNSKRESLKNSKNSDVIENNVVEDIEKDIKANKISVLTSIIINENEERDINNNSNNVINKYSDNLIVYSNLILHNKENNKQITAMSKYIYNRRNKILELFGYNFLNISEKEMKKYSNSGDNNNSRGTKNTKDVDIILNYFQDKIDNYFKTNQNNIDFYLKH